jgi:DNA-binding transcriptional MerR regulator
MTDTEFLTKADVAKQLGITPGAIEKAEREGRIAATTRTRGGVRLYTAENVAAFESLRAAGRRQRKPAKG